MNMLVHDLCVIEYICATALLITLIMYINIYTAGVCITLLHVYHRQEGWRLEHEDPTDPKSPIIFKGVVFNEMKGVFVSYRTSNCTLYSTSGT